ncbi:MAG: site-specific integrase [Acidimicrobiales bacterium]
MGSVENQAGRYRAKYGDPLGRQRSETFTRKADAERFLREMQVEIDRGQWLDPAAPTSPSPNGPRTSCRCAAGCHRSPRRPTSETPPSTCCRASVSTGSAVCLQMRSSVENWLDDEIAAGRAPSSVHRHYRTLRRMLQVAVEKQKIVANPCDRVQPPRVPDREMVFLGWEQVVDLAEVHSERYRTLIYLAVDSGMSWSEFVGLRRSKIDLRVRKVRVTEQLVRLGTGEWLRKEPKTRAGLRSITMSPITAELLGEHLERFSLPGLDGLVFPNRADHPLISSSWWNNNFAPALKRAGLRCRFHDLRHTSVALAIAEGRTRRRSRPGWVTARSG